MKKSCNLCGRVFEVSHNRSIRCPECQKFKDHVNLNIANRNRRRKKHEKIQHNPPGFWEKAALVINAIESGRIEFYDLNRPTIERQYMQLKLLRYNKKVDGANKETTLASWIEKEYLKKC